MALFLFTTDCFQTLCTKALFLLQMLNTSIIIIQKN